MNGMIVKWERCFLLLCRMCVLDEERIQTTTLVDAYLTKILRYVHLEMARFFH